MIIGIIGRVGSGKDTTAKMLRNVLGGTIMKFATPLKEIISIITGCSIQDLENQSFKTQELPEYLLNNKANITTYRQLLQFLGTELFKGYLDDDFWIKVNSNKILEEEKKSKIVYISDVRFQNELDFIRSNGGFVIKLERFSDTPISHSSENIDQLEADWVIHNEDGDLMNLRNEVLAIANYLNGKISF